MRFKNFELYVDNRVFDSSDMKQIVSADADYFQHNKEIYLIDKKKDSSSRKKNYQ